MFHVSKKPDEIKYFIPNAYIFSLLIAGGSSLIFFVTGKLCHLKIINMLGWQAIILGVITTPFLSMLTFQGQYFLAVHAYKMSKARLAVTESLPLLAYLLVYSQGKISIFNILLAYSISRIICFIVFHIIISRNHFQKGGFSINFAKASFQFGVRQYSSDLILFLVSRLDFFLVTYFLGQTGLGVYAVAVSLAEVTMRLPSELGTILFPAFAAGHIPSGQAAPILRKTLFLAVLASLVLFILGEHIVLILFGRDFQQAIPAFRWLLLGTVAWSTIFVTWNNISAGGRPELGLPIFAGAALIDIVLNIILLPKMGIVGASIAATVSYFFAAAIFLMIFLKTEQCTIRDALLIRSDDLRNIFMPI